MKMIVYYSGDPPILKCAPEVILGHDANVMLTYKNFAQQQKPEKRFTVILRSRKQPTFFTQKDDK